MPENIEQPLELDLSVYIRYILPFQSIRICLERDFNNFKCDWLRFII